MPVEIEIAKSGARLAFCGDEHAIHPATCFVDDWS